MYFKIRYKYNANLSHSKTFFPKKHEILTYIIYCRFICVFMILSTSFHETGVKLLLSTPTSY